MKFGYAWTFVKKSRGGTLAPPPVNRALAVPRRRLPLGIRIGPPPPNWLQVSTVRLRRAGKPGAHWSRILGLKNCIFCVRPHHG